MTRLVVQKYGGSILTDNEAFARAARHVAQTVAGGYRVVAVVSALAGVTDQLLTSARGIDRHPTPAALDLLLATGELQSAALLTLALHFRGLPAEALNPWQLGLHTDGSHGSARITRINPLPLEAKLAEVPVVIVPGFLGCGEDNRLTTLGRGGSDLTAVALSDILQAETCEFFKDVPGYFSADPHLVPEAVHRPRVSGVEAFELSRFGCRFLQDRAIAWAVENQCRVRLRALGEDERATVLSDAPVEERPEVMALTHCEKPGPQALPSALVSLVGLHLGRNTRIRAVVSRALEENAIPYGWFQEDEHRLTLDLPARSLQRAQRILHDRLITENKPFSTPPTKGKDNAL